jgi:hypothetical protein
MRHKWLGKKQIELYQQNKLLAAKLYTSENNDKKIEPLLLSSTVKPL